MSILERVLEPGSAESPLCVCGEDMRLAKIEPNAITDDAETRDFECGCGHRMKLMIWKA